MNACDEKLLKRLQKPDRKVDVVLDTDTYNEIDDQFALAYLLKSPEKLNVKAIYAAPFFNLHSSSPEDGMLRSYDEIKNVLQLMECEKYLKNAYKGATGYLKDEKTFVDSDAARDLAQRAMQYTPENPLYVVAIAAITNVASAILMQPDIADRIVIVWLGGHAYHWPNTNEFNMAQDVAAARIVFGCGAAVVQLPCMGVVSAFSTTGPELEHWLRGKNKLCDYLCDVTQKEAELYGQELTWSRPIWDVTAVAWLLDKDLTMDKLVHSPVPTYDNLYSFDETRHFIRYVYHIDRDKLFMDLFKKLAT